MADSATVVQDLADRLDVERTTIWHLCRRYEEVGVEVVGDAPRDGRPRTFSSLQRGGIERLACCDPLGLGLHMTHWSTRSLAQVAAERGLVPAIAHSTVSLILRTADLQPHRSRVWKTPTIDAAFLKSAARILWCYENVENLAKKGESCALPRREAEPPGP